MRNYQGESERLDGCGLQNCALQNMGDGYEAVRKEPERKGDALVAR